MIKKTSKGFKVTSESGKNLSAKNLSKGEAEKRLAEIEWFKAHPKAAGRDAKMLPGRIKR